jgi:branched-chain amino acid transport system substrate-binding protein
VHVLETARRGRTGLAKAVLASTVISAALMGGALSAGASSALGSPHPAKGSTVSVGLISDAGSGAVGTGALVEQGAKMAVAYANAYANGINGHKIKLVICENNETPSGGQTCANQMVQDGVVAVVVPFTGEGATEVPTITKAGIPYITLSGASTEELTTTGAFDLTGGFPADLGAIALQAKAHGYKKVAFLVSNVPAAIQGAQVLGSLVFKKAGVGFQVIPVNPGTADMTPQLQTAVSGGASAIGIVGDVTLCSSFLQGYQTLALKLPKYVLSTCQDPSILNSPTLDKVLQGSYITTTTTASSKDRALYAAITKKYAPKVNPNPDDSANQASGLLPVLSLLAIMKGSTGPVTAATVMQRITTATNVVLPFSGGITFTCNGKAISLLKSVCSASAALGVVGKGASVTHTKTYNPSSLF